jgi:predicted permease
MPRIVRHLVAWFRRGRLDEEMRDELAQHVEWRTQALVDDGVPEIEARRQAALAVGNVTRLKEEARAMWGFPALDTVIQDLQYGARLFRRSPAFTAVAVLSLAIGIGSSSAVFSLADTVLMRKLAVRDPDALVALRWASGPIFPFSSLNGNSHQDSNGLGSTSFSLAAYRGMRQAAQSSVDLFGFADLYRVTASAGGRAEMASAHAVSDNYFTVVGVPPAAGRSLGAADDRGDAQPAAMISDGFWLRRFNRAPDVVGQPLLINGVSFTIAGVTPPQFHGTGQVLETPDLFVPLSMRGRLVRSEESSDDPNFWWVLMMGRLHPGITQDQVQGVLDTVLKQTVAAAKPALASKDLPHLQVLPGSRGQAEARDGMREPLRVMAIVVTIVLLVACANVANLLLARGRARVRELSVRVAIGAPRRRVVRQLLTEGLLLALCGCALGIVTARWIAGALMPALSDAPLPAGSTGLDIRLVLFAALLAGGCAIVFALAPALRATDVSLVAGLQEAGRGAGAARHRGGLAAGLVITQIALSMVLVATAALLVQSVRNLRHVDLGFNPRNVLLFRIDPTLNGYDEARVRATYARLLERLRAAPGVRDVTLTDHPLISHSSSIGVAARPEEPLPERGSEFASSFMETHQAWRLSVDTRFFTTMEIPIVRGRAFTDADVSGTQPIAVINQTVARRMFATDDVIGRLFRMGLRKDAPLYEVIGVSADARYTSVREPVPPTIYLLHQRQPPGEATFEVRTAGDPAAFATTAREIVREVDPNLPIFTMRPQGEQIAASLDRERLFARLAALLGGVTLALSAIGLYALLAYAVTRRTPEIGVRMALGADRSAVAWMILKQSLVLAALGLLLGIAGSAAGSKAIESLLYELPARDPGTLAGAAAIMLAVSAIAGYLPARRASRVDPLVALRAE